MEGLVLGFIRILGGELGGVGEGGEAFYDKGGGLVDFLVGGEGAEAEADGGVGLSGGEAEGAEDVGGFGDAGGAGGAGGGGEVGLENLPQEILCRPKRLPVGHRFRWNRSSTRLALVAHRPPLDRQEFLRESNFCAVLACALVWPPNFP